MSSKIVKVSRYRCRECDHEWNPADAALDEHPNKCPECESFNAERIAEERATAYERDGAQVPSPDPAPICPFLPVGVIGVPQSCLGPGCAIHVPLVDGGGRCAVVLLAVGVDKRGSL